MIDQDPYLLLEDSYCIEGHSSYNCLCERKQRNSIYAQEGSALQMRSFITSRQHTDICCPVLSTKTLCLTGTSGPIQNTYRVLSSRPSISGIGTADYVVLFRRERKIFVVLTASVHICAVLILDLLRNK